MSMRTHLETMRQSFQVTNSTNSTDTAFTAKSPTKTEPTGDGVIGMDLSLAQFVFYGRPADDTFSARIYGWRVVQGTSGDTTPLWIPTLIVEVAVQTSTNTNGVGGEVVTASDYFCDSITYALGDATVGISSPGITTDEIASLTIDPKGATYLEVAFDLTGTATAANALVTRF